MRVPGTGERKQTSFLTYLRWSAYKVSKAREDFPEPEKACDYCETVAGNYNINILEIINTCTFYFDLFWIAHRMKMVT